MLTSFGLDFTLHRSRDSWHGQEELYPSAYRDQGKLGGHTPRARRGAMSNYKSEPTRLLSLGVLAQQIDFRETITL